MTWRTIILTKDSKISLRLKHLVVKNDGITTIPLAEIGQLIIENPNIIMTGHILNALSQYKITTIICNDKHLPYSHINLIYGHYHQVEKLKKQIAWPYEHKQILWQNIIKEKIKNQRKVLDNLHIVSVNQLNDYIEQVKPGDITNREGHAAKVYFNQLFGMTFIRGSDNPINWALNYGYSLLLALFTRVIITKGLLTEMGIHHRNQFNHYNLASDFMEVYRPMVDEIVKENVYEEFTKNERRKLLGIFNMKVNINNRNQYLNNSVDVFVDSLIRYLESGDLKQLNFPNFK